jgi:hypothetical protein
MHRFTSLFLVVPIAAGGCLFPEPETVLVPPNSTAPLAAPVPRQVSYSAPSTEAAKRVETVGQKLLTANPELGLKPRFHTIGASPQGAPPAEVFHQATEGVYITETLVKQCATEGQLAAVLSQELGKMVSEREALAGPQGRAPEREAPLDVRLNSDYVGSFGGPADHTNLAERAKFDTIRRPGSPLPPDPAVLARAYLAKAGYAPADYEQAAPLLRQAAVNHTLEKQLVNPGPARPWTKN